MATSAQSESSEVGQAGDKAPDKLASQSRSFSCTTCNLSFRRLDHLKRHAKLHTHGKRYQCPCGERFSRNDVLAQHLRRCEKARDQEGINTTQTRSKRACDRCARLKMKCNSQSPCDRCIHKKVSCEFTRPGYTDPYERYGIGGRADDSDNSNLLTSNFNDSPNTALYETSMVDQDAPALDKTGRNSEMRGALPLHQTLSNMDLLYGPHAEDLTLARQLETFDFHDLDHLSKDCGFVPMFDWNFFEELQLGNIFNPIPTVCEDMFVGKTVQPIEEERTSADLMSAPASYQSFSTAIPMGSTTAKATPVYSMNQLDPVEAKCAEIRLLLHASEPLVTEDMIATSITRNNLVLGVQLFGKHFQRNFPILHAPTFTLVDTSPILLLAMMLNGACYSHGVISNAHITKLAMRLLILIENLPHEVDMQTPKLSTIQASIIICGILVCSRNETACKFVPVHFARNISMADRAGVFEDATSTDYSKMTEDKFNWSLWIAQESRRRIASEILCQDMAACVFQGKSPSLSPLTLQVQLPCYEACWEAQTSSDCFRKLQELPQQIKISAASRYLRTSQNSVPNSPLFEASSFGMFTLMMGLHGFLHQTMQEDLDPVFTNSAMPFHLDGDELPPSDGNRLGQLNHDYSGASIALRADSAVLNQGSMSIKRANMVLNAWHLTWQLRQVRENQHENITFKGDPLRFWWLAKLLLVAHVLGKVNDKDSELSIPSPCAVDEKGKIDLQAKLIKWMSRFRGPSKEADISADNNVLPKLMTPL